MWCLWIKTDEKWAKYATFEEETGEYAKQVLEGVLRAKKSDNESRRNAAIVMEAFVLDKGYYAAKQGKILLRALRYFDEVGLSNDIHDALEEVLDEGGEAVALLQEGEEITAYAQASLDIKI